VQVASKQVCKWPVSKFASLQVTSNKPADLQTCEPANLHLATSIRKVMAVVEYDGTDYHGFQIQPQQRTIQGEIERALARITQEDIRIVGAGRTDAGVHAKGQVISFSTSWDRPLGELRRALNAVLPRDIAIHEIRKVPEGFNARYSAVSREYRYSIWNAPTRSPLMERFVYHYPQPLDLTRMNEACSYLVGTHDFASFGSPPKEGGSTVRTLYRAECDREGDLVYVVFVANAFLCRMVRSLVSALLQVGTGRLAPDDLRGILLAKDRDLVKVTVPPQGLCLVKVNYPQKLQGESLRLS